MKRSNQYQWTLSREFDKTLPLSAFSDYGNTKEIEVDVFCKKPVINGDATVFFYTNQYMPARGSYVYSLKFSANRYPKLLSRQA